MYTGLILILLATGQTTGMSSPPNAFETEEECAASVQEQVVFIKNNNPTAQAVVGYCMPQPTI